MVTIWVTVVTQGQASNPSPDQPRVPTPSTMNRPPQRFNAAARMDVPTHGDMMRWACRYPTTWSLIICRGRHRCKATSTA